MDYLVQFQINIFSIIILVVLFAMIRVRSKIGSFGKKLLILAIYLTIAAAVVDPLAWIFDGSLFFGARFLEYSTNFVLVLLSPAIGAVMLSYVDYTIYRDLSRLKKRLFYSHFTMLTLLILIVNIFVPLYFSVDFATNRYASGDYHFVHSIIVALMYLYMLIFLILNRKKTNNYVIYIFTLFFSLPIIGMVIQMLESHLNFTWASVSLSILVTYIYLESTTGEVDYLTKLFTRQSYELYVINLIEKDLAFEVCLIDLDNFKQINDEYGHVEGDRVLYEFGQALLKSFSPNRMIARLGGDEFIVVVEQPSTGMSEQEKILAHLQKSNDTALLTLRFSCGWQSFEAGMSMDELYRKVDSQMYKNKQKNKNQIPLK